MSRVFEKHEFQRLARRATDSVPDDVMKRFRFPLVGTLTCIFVGSEDPKNEFIIYNTKIVFRWELSGLHVTGSISQAHGH